MYGGRRISHRLLIDSFFCVASSRRGLRYELVSWSWRGSQWGHEQTHIYCQTSCTRLSIRLLNWTVEYFVFALLLAHLFQLRAGAAFIMWPSSNLVSLFISETFTCSEVFLCSPFCLTSCTIVLWNATWEIPLGKTAHAWYHMSYALWKLLSIFGLFQKVKKHGK